MTSFFSAEGGPILIKFRRLVQNDMSTAVMWSKLKPDVEYQYGGHLGEFNVISSHSHLPHCRMLRPGEFSGMSSQSHVSHCRVLPLGEFNVMIPQTHATLQGAVSMAKSMSRSYHIAGCKNLIRLIQNGFSPYFIFLGFFLNAVCSLTSGGFRVVFVSVTLVKAPLATARAA